ncbi:MAG: hypothetical protein ACRYGA_14140 [Janthinobacterium lividum]
MLRFDSPLHAEDWFQSDARHELPEEAAPLLADPDAWRTVTGLEFRFDAASGVKPARRYKQSCSGCSFSRTISWRIPLPP